MNTDAVLSKRLHRLQSLLQYTDMFGNTWHARLKGCSFTSHARSLEAAIELADSARIYQRDFCEPQPNEDLFS